MLLVITNFTIRTELNGFFNCRKEYFKFMLQFPLRRGISCKCHIMAKIHSIIELQLPFPLLYCRQCATWPAGGNCFLLSFTVHPVPLLLTTSSGPVVQWWRNQCAMTGLGNIIVRFFSSADKNMWPHLNNRSCLNWISWIKVPSERQGSHVKMI